jgi:TolB-like protein
VLPFVNMSGDPKQDYFSDGLSEELLNSLTSVRDLQVAARTSSFYFKGKEVDLSEVAHKLNVGALLEGSVRKDGQHVRITAQLINALTGFHIWSQTYDRDLKDVLKLQSEIAAAVTQALQAALLSDPAASASADVGGTQNPRALDAYLRGKNLTRAAPDASTLLNGVAAFEAAVKIDPAFAKAWASMAIADVGYAQYYGTDEQDIRAHFDAGRAAAQRAVSLAPALGQAHLALAEALEFGYLDLKGALAEYDKALPIAPNDAELLAGAGDIYVNIGRTEAGVRMARRAASLDQINPRTHRALANTLTSARLYSDAIDAANNNISVSQNDSRGYAIRGLAQVLAGDPQSGTESCERSPRDWGNFLCLAIAYDRLHRHADAESQVAIMKAQYHDATAYQLGEIYAQWGDSAQALSWLQTARKLRDPGLTGLKTDPLLDPLRGQKDFQVLLAELAFPD